MLNVFLFLSVEHNNMLSSFGLSKESNFPTAAFVPVNSKNDDLVSERVPRITLKFYEQRVTWKAWEGETVFWQFDVASQKPVIFLEDIQFSWCKKGV